MSHAVVTPIETRKHVLYRAFSASGELLYVGISVDFSTRMSSHSRDSSWWSEVANLTLEHFDTRSEVLAAEAAAITTERPERNKRVGMIKRTYYVDADLYEAALAKTVERDEDLAEVIRRALLAYVEEGK